MFGFTLIAVLSIRILVNYLINLPSVQKYLEEEESESNKKTTEYCLMITPVILFSIIQLFINPKYIFVVTNKDNQYIFVLYIVAFIIYYLDTQNIFDPPEVKIEETHNNNDVKNHSNNQNNNKNIKTRHIKNNNNINSISIDTSKVRL